MCFQCYCCLYPLFAGVEEVELRLTEEASHVDMPWAKLHLRLNSTREEEMVLFCSNLFLQVSEVSFIDLTSWHDDNSISRFLNELAEGKYALHCCGLLATGENTFNS